jgi:hypothetical protein
MWQRGLEHLIDELPTANPRARIGTLVGSDFQPDGDDQ